TGMPKAGGSYYYVNRALGPFFGSIVGWGMWAGLMFASAFYMLGFGQYLTYFVNMGSIGVAGSALAMSILLIMINYRGVKETGGLQNVIVLALVGVIIVFVSFGILQVDMEILRPFNPEGWSAVAATAATVYVTFIGFEVIATSAEEIKNPARNLPLSMIASVLTPTLFYILVMFVSTGTLPIPAIAESRIPVADVADIVMGPWGALMMVAGAVLATVSSANASILSAARVNFAMGRDKILTSWLNEIHKKFRTPYRAILTTGVVILVLISLGVGIETLADVASFMYLLTYSLVHVAVIVMREAHPEEYNPDFKLPFLVYPVVPFLGFLACIIIMFQMNLLIIGLGLGITICGALWFVLYARKHASTDHLIGEAISPSAKRAEDEEEHYRIVVPVANPETETHLLRLAAASANAHENGELVVVNIIQVPPQTALAQDVKFEEEKVNMQQRMLEQAREFAETHDIGLRTRAIIGRSISGGILDILREEQADQVLMGWQGRIKRRDHILGSNIDDVVNNAPCDVSLVKVRHEDVNDIVVLAGGGPDSPRATQRGYELMQANEGANLSLLRVEQTTKDPSKATENGESIIESVAQQANLPPKDYESEVVLDDLDEVDIHDALLEAVDGFDTVVVGATGASSFRQALFGSIPETIGEKADGTVIMVRRKRHKPKGLFQALFERFG
ncbi:MAG: amino acid permease, partial [bacterium]